MPWEQIFPGLGSKASTAVTFLLPPRIELPASALPAGLNLASRSEGMGHLL